MFRECRVSRKTRDRFVRAKVTVQEVSAETFEMANSSVKMTIKEGRITSLIDVALEQVFPASMGSL